MASDRRALLLNDYEHRLMVRSLSDFRNGALRDGKPTENVDNLILKVINAPIRRERWRFERAAR